MVKFQAGRDRPDEEAVRDAMRLGHATLKPEEAIPVRCECSPDPAVITLIDFREKAILNRDALCHAFILSHHGSFPAKIKKASPLTGILRLW
jgi:hypothetical protein